MSVILESIGALEQRVNGFRDSMNPDVAAERIGVAVDKVRETFRNDALGVKVDLTPEDVAKKYTTAARAQYNKNLRETAATISKELTATDQALAMATTAAATLPHPVDALELQALSDTTRATERLRIAIEQDRAERRLAGKTLAQVIEIYAQAKDERDATLVWYIEAQQAAGWAETSLAPSSREDATGMVGSRLKSAIEERQKARVAKNYPELAQARERLEKLRRSATLDSHIKHLQGGRGLASVS